MNMKKEYRKELAALKRARAAILAAADRDYNEADRLYERTIRRVGKLADRNLKKLDRRIAILIGRLAG